MKSFNPRITSLVFRAWRNKTLALCIQKDNEFVQRIIRIIEFCRLKSYVYGLETSGFGRVLIKEEKY